eukprot:13251134-Alexandrium_andersonii.AAC.1
MNPAANFETRQEAARDMDERMPLPARPQGFQAIYNAARGLTRGNAVQAAGGQVPAGGLPADQGPANQPPPAPEGTGTDPYERPYVFRSLQDVSFMRCTANEHRQELTGAFTPGTTSLLRTSPRIA